MRLSEIKFLVVEKTVFACQLVQDTLFELGARNICHATNAVAAMEHIRAGRADFLICEHELNDENGLDLIGELRGDDDQTIKKIPVVLLTASTNRASIFSGRDAGVDEIVAKPFTAAALKSHIEAVITRRRDFIDKSAYAGPDRRRLKKKGFTGDDRRED